LRHVNVDAPLTELDWLSAQRARQLERVGVDTAGALLTHFPRRYEDRRRFDRFPSSETSDPICVRGIVKTTRLRRLRGWQKMFDAVLEEEESHALSEPLVCRWFNSHWVEKMIAKGQRLIVHGRAKRSGAQMVMTHPEFEAVEDDAENSIHLNRITPIHRATEGLSPRLLRRIIWETLARFDESPMPTVLPATLDAMARGEALRQIHFPDSFEALAAARRHLVLTEFFEMQLRIVANRASAMSRTGAVHCGPGRLLEKLHTSLPFALTTAQRRAIGEIRADLAAARPMNRLLHGDVGSGKTVVALSAMLLVVEAGFQAALMAPTQILAEQHYLTFKRLLEPLGIPVFLRTSARSEGITPLPLFAGGRDASAPANVPAENGAAIFVGTHALLFAEGELANLGLAVIDEQHKFGVMQRARLRNQGVTPDVLVMTATPIPRTLTMTVYGDLDVSTLDEVPAHRGKIITAVRENAKLPEAIQFLRDQLGAGRQAYIVYPLIDEIEKRSEKAAAVEFEKWRELLVPFPCDLLHGRMRADEKEAVMERFRAGKTKALIATTVIEVGIDVPNATLMFIEDAARFGLAQLHQLRGRIGRGPHRSYCVLFTSEGKDDAEALEKLRVLESTTDGFAIAEADLRLRGPGDILGTAQSGLPPLKLGDIIRDGDLMTAARRAAQEVFAADCELLAPEHALYRDLLASAQGRRTVAELS
jgi:ATP-dependent DNA helicase RecG